MMIISSIDSSMLLLIINSNQSVNTNLHKLNFHFLSNIWYLDVQMKNVYKDGENDNTFAFFSKMNFALICMIKPNNKTIHLKVM